MITKTLEEKKKNFKYVTSIKHHKPSLLFSNKLMTFHCLTKNIFREMKSVSKKEISLNFQKKKMRSE